MSVSVLNTDAVVSGKTVMMKEVSETVSGVKTFSAAPVFSVAPTISAGLKFPASQNAVADANTLDDYEEGSWTPTIVSSGGGTPTYTVQTGLYTKVGNTVFCEGRVTISAFGSLAAGTITIASLPFTASATTHGTATIPFWGTTATAMSNLSGYVFANSTTIIINAMPAAGATSQATQMTKADMTGSFDMIFSCTYLV